MKSSSLVLAACAFLAASASSLFALDSEVVIDVLPTAALARTGPSSPWMQTEATEMTVQAALSHTQPITDGLSIFGSLWAIADTLPSHTPLSTPPSKVDIESRILELRLAWEIVPGTLIWDVGKEVIHPSSGFFRTPLNVLSHGALGGAENLTGSAVGAWEEGWVGTGLKLLVGDVSISNFFSPRMVWADDVDGVLRYVSARQNDYENLARVDIRLGATDLQILGLLSSGGAGSADPELRFTGGAGLDASIGDSLTVRAEVSIVDSQDRTVVVDSQTLATSTETVAWAPRALAGLTWTSRDQLTVMGEYFYNGMGFVGGDYSRLIGYTQSLRNTPGLADQLDQLGSFSAARHYGFLRVSGKIDDTLSAAAWTTVNLQDLSGFYAIVLTLTHDVWSVNASLMDAWGGTDTEAGLSPLLWRADVGVSLFL